MSSYWETSGAIPLSGKLRQRLDRERGVSFARASGLRMVARQRQHGSQTIIDFHVFDPAALGDTIGEPPGYADVESGAILYSGHIEPDGTIFLNS